MSSADHL